MKFKDFYLAEGRNEVRDRYDFDVTCSVDYINFACNIRSFHTNIDLYSLIKNVVEKNLDKSDPNAYRDKLEKAYEVEKGLRDVAKALDPKLTDDINKILDVATTLIHAKITEVKLAISAEAEKRLNDVVSK